MGKIHVLSQDTVNQIAAGEVIERPSSVVKELAENAMDAQATAVTVEIKDGGISFVRVTDNGCGFEREDIPTAFLRHSTSKISDASDLTHVSSLGFRGEALSSIAAVSRVELITCAAGQTVGTRYRIEGGEEISMEDTGAPEGTTIIMRDLFYNTPVRRKFLKTSVTEAASVSELMERMALSRPDISYRLLVNGQMKLHTAGNHNLKDIIYSIYGRDVTAGLVPVEAHSDFISVSGYLGKPESARGNRNYEIYFVNGRYVKSKVIQKALEDGYKGFLMQHKYPFVILHLDIDPEYLDVNVHPAKKELRLRAEPEMYEFLVGTVHDTLLGKELIPRVSLTDDKDADNQEADKDKKARIPEPFEKERLRGMNQSARSDRSGQTDISDQPDEKQQTVRSDYNGNISAPLYEPDTGNARRSSAFYEPGSQRSGNLIFPEGMVKDSEAGTGSMKMEASAGNTQPESPTDPEGSACRAASLPERQETVRESARYDGNDKGDNYTQASLFDGNMVPAKERAQFRIIGQLFDTYWLVETGDEFLIIDQHAAHEKIMYERMMKQLEQEEIPAQQVAPPIILTLTPAEAETVANNSEIFRKMGYSLEPFGGREYAVYSVPDQLYGIADRDLLMEMIDELTQDSGQANSSTLAHRVATASCKAAVKGNNRLSFAEAEELLKELFSLDNPYNCPHGRPTVISMSRYEIEKKFKRVL